MILYPAIDLKDGDVVRLAKGEMDQATVFGSDPGAQAKQFAVAGAEWIHVVDLNGAFAGEPVNADAVTAILDAVDVPVQLGGGIRTLETIDFWLAAGVRRVVLGTVAVKDPELVMAACLRHPGRIAVGVDARDGMVATEGWAATSDVPVIDLAKQFEGCGVAALIHTDIDRDGVLAGPNVAASAELAEAVSIPVIVSGGVSSYDDLKAVREASDSGIAGVISGRALYDGRIDVAEAIAVLKGSDDA